MRSIELLAGTRHLCAATVLPAALAIAALAAAEAAAPDGFELYVDNCSNCHGMYGEGDGAMAPDLPVALKDLRYLNARNGGRFPRDYLVEIIDGRAVRTTHGPEGMPVWGEVFAREPAAGGETARGEAKIAVLVDFLESLQIE